MTSLAERLIILWSTPLYILLIVGEIILSHYHDRNLYSFKDSVTNFVFMLLNSGIDLLWRSTYFLVMMIAYEYKLFEITNPWIYFFTLLIAEDFLFYWLHRIEHTVRILWAVHVTHHSSEKFNLTTGFRSSVFQPLYRFIFFLPLAILGFKPLDIMLVFSATQIWGILVHTKAINKMGFLEHILVTPSHHRVHHASNILYLDKNMGMFLILWDKLFGTFQQELPESVYEPIKYGITKDTSKLQYHHKVLHEFEDLSIDLRNHPSLSDKINYLIQPPGWSADGSTKTTRQLHKEIAEQGNILVSSQL